MIENKQKGITLISLIVTIIVLLILAVVSVNSIMGENGIIARAKESRILTILADILFNLDSNIIDINTDNILNDKKMVSTEMMEKLIGRGLIEGKDDYSDFWAFEESLQYKVKGTNIENFFVSYNGDVWLDNYKRGKIQLTQNVDTIYTQNAQTKITVIDGTVEELTPNKEYYLHAIKGRNDFICWVNQYGEIISYFADTVIDVGHRKETEYTAIYNKNWRKDYYGKTLVGIDSDASKNGEEIDFDLNITYLNGGCGFIEYIENEEVAVYSQGMSIAGIFAYISPNYEDLIGVDNEGIGGDAKYLWNYYNEAHKDWFEDADEEDFAYFPTILENNFSEIPEELDFCEYGGLDIPAFKYEDLSYFSERYCVSKTLSYDDILLNFQKEDESINRIYYRTGIFVIPTIWSFKEDDGTLQLYYFAEEDDIYKGYDYLEPVIKYVDL